MNTKTKEKLRIKTRIEGLNTETGGTIIAPFGDNIPEEFQPSQAKVFWVFGSLIASLLVGALIGWAINDHFTQAAKHKSEVAAMEAEFNLARNQAQIDNFCRLNSNLSKQ